ncbi:MAG TPA: ribose-5-phosphate isomerase A, partial [Nevskiaceae bacterium]|nr:ribose-5-phosphate isomerase A [Nevskiaceae bacterium]
MSQDELKRKAAQAALKYIQPGEVIGIGTGSTVNHFIDLLAARKQDVLSAVSSSEASTRRLKSIGIQVIDLNEAGTLSVYVDGADEATRHRQLIKGGGGALTR